MKHGTVQKVVKNFTFVSETIRIDRGEKLFRLKKKKYIQQYLIRMMYYSVSDTGILGKKSECSYQESNLRLSDYWFGCSTTELQETRGSRGH